MAQEREKISVQVGARIRTLRTSKKMSQEELALAAGLTPAYLGRVERGEKCPSVETIHKISLGLSVPMTEIVDISDDLSPAKEQALKRIEGIFENMPDDAALRLADFIQQLADFRNL